jgi:drug/metabolite transporter (DMT)-like permease
MVGSEDEPHFMVPAGWWSTAGLVLGLIGVLLLFRYGMPYRVRTGGPPIRAISSDPRAATLERRYKMLGWLGLFLIVVGTMCQIVGTVLNAR